jgi:hypothetical protein
MPADAQLVTKRALPMQVDGEPWNQAAATIEITAHSKQPVLRRVVCHVFPSHSRHHRCLVIPTLPPRILGNPCLSHTHGVLSCSHQDEPRSFFRRSSPHAALPTLNYDALCSRLMLFTA